VSVILAALGAVFWNTTGIEADGHNDRDKNTANHIETIFDPGHFGGCPHDDWNDEAK
jgi:hypothetical protein